MSKRTLSVWYLALSALLFLSGCQNYRSRFMDDARSRGFTEEQSLALFAYADRAYFSKKVAPDKEEYVVVYSRLKTADVRKRLETVLSNADQILDYKNEEEAKFIDGFGLRKDLEHEERVFEAILARVRSAELDDTFQSWMGRTSASFQANAGGYDIQRIFMARDLRVAFPFNSDQIEEAKKRGTLKEIEHGIWVFDRMFDRKEPDPQHLDDPNAFIWKSKKEALELTNYKILDVDKPDTNQGNYIEGYRTLDGKREQYPAIKIFFPHNSNFGILVLDVDKAGRGPGYGLPDFVERVMINSISEIARNDQLLSRIFEEREKRIRTKLPEKLIQVEIVRVGQPMDVWQQAPDAAGWMVPMQFRNDLRNNYNVRVKLARPSHADDPSIPPDAASSIEWIAREWTNGDFHTPSIGAVVEYFKTKIPYDQPNVTKLQVIHWESTKKIALEFLDGSVEQGIIAPDKNKFILDEPFAVEYTEGQKRWRIEKDMGSAVFNKRKEITQPQSAPGVY